MGDTQTDTVEGSGSSASLRSADGEYGREWLRGLLSDLADDGLVEVQTTGDGTVARLRE